MEQSGTDTEGWPCRMVIWRAVEGDAGAVCGGRYPEAGWLSADCSCSLKSLGDQERLGRAGIGVGVGRGYPEPQPHPQSFTQPPTPLLQMGDLRALPAPIERPCPAWTYRKEDI